MPNSNNSWGLVLKNKPQNPQKFTHLFAYSCLCCCLYSNKIWWSFQTFIYNQSLFIKLDEILWTWFIEFWNLTHVKKLFCDNTFLLKIKLLVIWWQKEQLKQRKLVYKKIIGRLDTNISLCPKMRVANFVNGHHKLTTNKICNRNCKSCNLQHDLQ